VPVGWVVGHILFNNRQKLVVAATNKTPAQRIEALSAAAHHLSSHRGVDETHDEVQPR